MEEEKKKKEEEGRRMRRRRRRRRTRIRTRRKWLQDDQKMGGNWKLKQKAINWNLSRMHFVRGYGSVVRQTTE